MTYIVGEVFGGRSAVANGRRKQGPDRREGEVHIRRVHGILRSITMVVELRRASSRNSSCVSAVSLDDGGEKKSQTRIGRPFAFLRHSRSSTTVEVSAREKHTSRRFPFRRPRTEQARKPKVTHIGGFLFNRATSSGRRFPVLPMNNASIPLTRPRSDFLRKPINVIRRLKTKLNHCRNNSDPEGTILLGEETDMDVLLNAGNASRRTKALGQKPRSNSVATDEDTLVRLSHTFINLLCDGLCCATCS